MTRWLRRRSRIPVVVLVVACGSCADGRRAPRHDDEGEKAALGGGVAARVGDALIPASLVAKVAADQKIEAREALRRLVDDAVAAEAARKKGLDARPPGSWNITAARARFTAERFMADARAKGPPTDDEIRELSALHWREVDRPPSVRVVHALAMTPKTGNDADARARAVAEALRAAALGATSADDFLQKTKAVAHPSDVDVRVEALPAFTADGSVVEGEGKMVEPFAAAAFALASAESTKGATSGLVQTPFGWHVIRLVERLPEQRMPWETRRVAFTLEAHAARAKRSLDAALEAQRAAAPVTILPSAEQLMRDATAREPSP